MFIMAEVFLNFCQLQGKCQGLIKRPSAHNPHSQRLSGNIAPHKSWKSIAQVTVLLQIQTPDTHAT